MNKIETNDLILPTHPLQDIHSNLSVENFDYFRSRNSLYCRRIKPWKSIEPRSWSFHSWPWLAQLMYCIYEIILFQSNIGLERIFMLLLFFVFYIHILLMILCFFPKLPLITWILEARICYSNIRSFVSILFIKSRLHCRRFAPLRNLQFLHTVRSGRR